MYRFLVSFLFVLFFAPLNAQHMVKYVTFYPVPYGSHQNLNVTDTAVISGRDGGESVIAGTLSVPSSPLLEGSVLLNVQSGTQLSINSAIRSGNIDTATTYGEAYMTGTDISLNNFDEAIKDVYAADTANVNSSVIYDDNTLSKLLDCGDGEPSWKALRLKGSEECKYYLTCGGSGNSGCEEAPDLSQCEFGPWIIMDSNDKSDTCGNSPKQGCIQISRCGASDRPCSKIREAVFTQVPTTFNCGMGQSLSQYCYDNSAKCTEQSVSSICRQHDGPKTMIIDGSYTPVEYCSFSNKDEPMYWCRENPSRKGCLSYSSSDSSMAYSACSQSYHFSGAASYCIDATVNIIGYVCQDVEDTSTMYYRVCNVI